MWRWSKHFFCGVCFGKREYLPPIVGMSIIYPIIAGSFPGFPLSLVLTTHQPAVTQSTAVMTCSGWIAAARLEEVAGKAKPATAAVGAGDCRFRSEVIELCIV